MPGDKVLERIMKDTMPNDKDAESRIIGSLILDSPRISDVASILKPLDFFTYEFQVIFKALINLTDNDEEINIVALKREVSSIDRGLNINAGTLTNLMDSVVTPTQVNSLAKIVKNLSWRRSVISRAVEAVNLGYDPSSDQSTVKAKLEEISDLSSLDIDKIPFKRLSELTLPASEMAESIALNKDGARGLDTGFYDLDRLLCGLKPGCFFVVGARPSMGKTSLACNISKNVASKGNSVLIFSLETTAIQLMLKFAYQQSRINSRHLMNGNLNDDEWKRFIDGLAYLHELPIYINDSATSLSDFKSVARQLHKKLGEIGLIVLDYVQLAESNKKHENRNQEIGWITRQIKKMGKEFSCPIIMLSQLSRNVENRTDKRPIMSDLRESGDIEQAADIVGFIYRPEVYDPDTDKRRIAEVIIRKNKEGSLGSTELLFEKEFSRFENLHTCKGKQNEENKQTDQDIGFDNEFNRSIF